MYLFIPVCWLYCLSVCLFFGCTILAMDFEFIMFVRAYSALGQRVVICAYVRYVPILA